MDKIKLVQTSEFQPEQYDAFFDENGNLVGYLRLRSGWFRVDFPKCGGETIFEAYPNGYLEFKENEREFYLNTAKQAIAERLQK